MKLFLVALLISICHGFILDLLEKDERFKPFRVPDDKVGNLQGVPNMTLCTPPGVTAHLTWTNYTVDPMNLQPNQQEHVTGNFTLDETVESGNINANIAVGGINILNQDLDLCEILPYIGLSRPVPKGPSYIDELETIPWVPYNGIFNLTINITDQNQ
eukprot:205906_1